MAASDHLQEFQMPGAGTKPGPGQGQLFYGRAGDEGPPDPTHIDNWIKQGGSQIAYHGTFRRDWQESPVLHAGPIDVASERLHNVATQLERHPRMREAYYSGGRISDDEWANTETDPEPQHHTGRVHAVRMTQEPHPGVVSDEEANIAHLTHVYNRGAEPHEIPGSVQDSAGIDVDMLPYDEPLPETPGSKVLGEGRGLRYRNYVEQGFTPNLIGSEQSASVAIPHGGHSTWERDVLAHEGSSELARNYARQRIAQGTEGSVAFPEAHVKHHGEGPQTVLPGMGEFHLPPVFKPRSRRNLSSIQFTTTEDDYG